MATKPQYSYIIIQDNYSELGRESALLDNKYKPGKKYALICKQVYKDGSESIAYIEYSNDLAEFHKRAKQFKSWYNYPLGIAKSLQGNLFEI